MFSIFAGSVSLALFAVTLWRDMDEPRKCGFGLLIETNLLTELRRGVMEHHSLIGRKILQSSILIFLAMISLTASSQTMCKPGPIGGCNWQEPFLVQEGNTIYQTRPGTTQRDWNADSWEVGKNGVARPKAPSAPLPDYSKPGMVVGKDWKGDLMVTPTDANGYQQRDQAIRYNIKK